MTTDVNRDSSNLLRSLIGKDVVDVGGGTVGQLERVYWRQEDGRPEWGMVSADLMEKRHVAVPLMDATFDEKISVPYPRDLINDTPELENDSITPRNVMDLYRHYNMRREAAAGEAATHETEFFNEWPEGPEVGQPEQSAGSEATPNAAVSHDDTSVRAYEIYLARGSKHGFDKQDWQKAEAQLNPPEEGATPASESSKD